MRKANSKKERKREKAGDYLLELRIRPEEGNVGAAVEKGIWNADKKGV